MYLTNDYKPMKDDNGDTMPLEMKKGYIRAKCETPNQPDYVASKSYMDDNTGWHGAKRITLMPRDFMGDDDSTFSVGIEDDGSAYGVRVKSSASELFCTVGIPARHRATHVMIYGNSTDSITVYEGDITDGSYTSKGTGNIGTEIDITDIEHTSTNYISILVNVNSTADIVYGGYVTLEGMY